MEAQKLLNTKEAAALIGSNPRTLDNWRGLGRGPVYVKLNKRNVRYALDDLLEYIARHRVTPAGGGYE
ncbi:MAG: helix-turn-helix domain-containing protein [Thermodesulfobacteriota bacterium]